jgi:hypothetical protein
MGLFDPILNPPANDQTLTRARKQVADQLHNNSSAIPVNLINMRNQAYNAFWSMDGGLTPQQKLKALRDNGYNPEEMFAEDAELVKFITSRLATAGAKPDQIAARLPGIPPQYKVTWNQGVVSIEDAE